MLTSLIIAIVLVGVVLYLINTFIPMDAKIKQLLNIVVLIVLVLYCLKAFGIFANVKLP